MSTIPSELTYTTSHEWVRSEGDGTLTIGITEHAQGLLGDMVFVELPDVDDEVTAGDEIAVVESVKAASDVYAPISGKVVAINDALEDAPELINSDSYTDGWLFRILPSDINELDSLIDAKTYGKSIE